MTPAGTISTALPAVADVADVVDLARRHAPGGAAAGRLDPAVVDAIARAGLFSLFVPHDLGGLEAGLPEACDAIAQLSEGDPAAGWAVMIGAGPAWFVGHMPPGLAAEVFGEGAAVAGSGSPGRAEPTGSGEEYLVSGRWPWCSGAPWARWFTFAAQPPETVDAGPPRAGDAGRAQAADSGGRRPVTAGGRRPVTAGRRR